MYVSFAVSAPYLETRVKPELVFALQPDPTTTADDTELLVDSDRTILVNEPLGQVATKMGGDFRQFEQGSSTDTIWINRLLVVQILPHATMPGVCYVMGAHRRVTVKGTLAAVTNILN
ncbi:MAG TPA: hypothetical protein VLL76_08525 [Candidatus Omnitrophota bacterium]|nr:hypothetical protein [Candidatus Omnitrophota bacterium]